MKKSFLPTFISKVLILFIFIIPLFVFAETDEYGNSTDPLPLPGENTPSSGEDESPVIVPEAGGSSQNNEDSGGILPPRPGSTDTGTDLGNDSGQGDTWDWDNPSDFNTGANTTGAAGGNTNNTSQQSQSSGNSYQPSTQNSQAVAGKNVPVLDRLVNPGSSGLNFGDQPLSKILNQLFFVGLVIAVILAIVMIIRGGVEYMTIDAISSKESGKNRVKAALGGLLLAFSSILILNTVNPNITSLSILFPEMKKVNQVGVGGITAGGTPTSAAALAASGWTRDADGNLTKKQSDGSTLVSTPDGKNYTRYPNGSMRMGLISPEGTVVTAPTTPSGKSEQEVRDYFKQNGININKDAGAVDADGVKGGFTNVGGLGEAAMLGVVNLKNASGVSSLWLTGGTERGHATHGVGKSIVDLGDKDATLNSYITNNAVRSYPRGSYTEYEHSNGTTYMKEGDHWHVEFK
jgi:hypothetical protein